MRTQLSAIAVLVLAGGVLRGQDCSGDPGCVLSTAPELATGSDALVSMTVPQNSLVYLMASLSGGPTPTGFGDLCVGFPLAAGYLFSLRTGTTDIPCFLPCDEAVVGLKVYTQFLAFPLAGGDVKRSNGICVEIVSGCTKLCPSAAEVDDYGPGTGGHVMWTNSCTGFSRNYVFGSGDEMFLAQVNGEAKLMGTLTSTTDPADQWCLDLCLEGLVSPGDVGYPPGIPKKELDPSAYVENGGPIDTDTWQYYTSWVGTLTGKGSNIGCTATIEQRGPSFQMGFGASGKNIGFGASAWINLDNSCVHHSDCDGDFNIDLNLCVQPLIDASFDSGADGFSYQDDCFRSTSMPAYASGNSMVTGLNGKALKIQVGGVDNADIVNMSGGWMQNISLPQDSRLGATFWYRLTMDSDYESDEWSQALISLDGQLVPFGGNDHLAMLVGNGNGGSDMSTGWVHVQLDLGVVSAGAHTLAIGAFNNKKTTVEELTVFELDELLVYIQQ